MVHGIFISYRKNDAHLLRQRLDAALTQRFGRGYVFKAGESIAPGSVYPETLLQEAGACDIMLALIGPDWLGPLVPATGEHRITADDDWVRREIAESLGAGKRVIPVLMGDGAVLPDPAVLPAEIRGLITHNRLKLTDANTDRDLEEIISKLIWILPALGDLRPADADPAPPTAPAGPITTHTQIAGDRGTNFDNSGSIRTDGGDFTIGDVDKSTTTYRQQGAGAYAAAGAEVGGLAALATIFKKTKAWAGAHRVVAPSIGALLGVGVLTVALVSFQQPDPSENPFAPHTATAALDDPASDPAQGPASTPSAAPAAAKTPIGNAVTGLVTDSQGDKLQLSLAIGQPEPLTDTNDPVAHDCDDRLEEGSINQVVVYPIEVTQTLESSVAVPIHLLLSQYSITTTSNMVQSAGVFGVDPEYGIAATVGGSDYCGVVDGDVTWQNESPGQTETFDGYILVTDAITPNDPTGLQIAGALFLDPDLSVGGGAEGDFTPDTANSPNLVHCMGSSGYMDSTSYVAMDYANALKDGCQH